MNIVQLKASIEIAFWDFTILLLSKSRVSQEFFCRIFSLINNTRHAFNARKAIVIAFSAGFFLLFGLVSGQIVAEHAPYRGPVAALSAISPPPTPSNGQVNLLVIGLDRLSSQKPQLVSVWLLGYFSGRSQVALIPIYPSLSDPQDREFQQIVNRFNLTSDGQPDGELVSSLQKKRIWWNGYLLIDEIGMIEMIDFIGGVKTGGHLLTGAQAVASLPPSEENASTALEKQTDLLQSLCRRTELLTPAVDLRSILNLIPDHVQTDLDVFKVIREWRDLLNGSQSIRCEFPLQNARLP